MKKIVILFAVLGILFWGVSAAQAGNALKSEASNDALNPLNPNMIIDAPSIAVNPSAFNVTFSQGVHFAKKLHITNEGDALLTYSVDLGADWLSASYQHDSVSGGETDSFTIYFNTEGLTIGDYSAVITINSNDPYDPVVEVPVNMALVQDMILDVSITAVDTALVRDGYFDADILVENNTAEYIEFDIYDEVHSEATNMTLGPLFGPYSTALPPLWKLCGHVHYWVADCSIIGNYLYKFYAVQGDTVIGYDEQMTTVSATSMNDHVPDCGAKSFELEGSPLNDLYLLSEDGRKMPFAEAQSLLNGDYANLPDEITVGAYPNPFNARTEIRYTLPSSSDVTLEIYNLIGQRVESLRSGYESAGRHSVYWDASTYSSGIYFARLTVGDKVITKRLALMK